eukprot:10007231-Alexandrium_andersonii.AAC.1
MSASLVGSEMCIRDRFVVMSPARRKMFGGGRVSLMRPESRSFWKGPHSCCLLYTSDAADDM